jgi:hypothetical protein
MLCFGLGYMDALGYLRWPRAHGILLPQPLERGDCRHHTQPKRHSNMANTADTSVSLSPPQALPHRREHHHHQMRGRQGSNVRLLKPHFFFCHIMSFSSKIWKERRDSRLSHQDRCSRAAILQTKTGSLESSGLHITRQGEAISRDWCYEEVPPSEPPWLGFLFSAH